MHYDKQIRYLEYLENGEKIRSAGFVKIEVMDQICNVQVNVTGLHPSESCNREVHLMGTVSADATEGVKERDGVLGEITLQSGKGILIRKRVPTDRLCNGIGYQDLARVRINLGKSRELVCRWREEQAEVREGQPKVSEEHSEVREEPPKVREEQALVREEQPEVREEPPKVREEPPEVREEQPKVREVQPQVREVQEEQRVQEELKVQETHEAQEVQKARELHETEDVQPKVVPVMQPAMPSTLHEKKWRQLSEIYPHIAPFRDERDYLSIGPSDFVILPEKYYRLINNSFLIHGFYNYGHMVLARTMKRGEEKYYIGVPGNFYEKERQVAIMFGFESFECRREPAQEGDFGYFMIRVEL